jgi:hypothetical protein
VIEKIPGLVTVEIYKQNKGSKIRKKSERSIESNNNRIVGLSLIEIAGNRTAEQSASVNILTAK